MFITKKTLQLSVFSVILLISIIYALSLFFGEHDSSRISSLKESERKGNASAMVELGVMYAKGDNLGKDEKTALGYFQKASLLESSAAVFNIALFYQYGKGGLTQDIPTAISYYEEAINQGSKPAMHNLATLYFLGKGTQQDYQKAFSLYEKAANLKYVPSMHNLAILYEKGLGVWKNKALAHQWMEKASKAGDSGATEYLAEMN